LRPNPRYIIPHAAEAQDMNAVVPEKEPITLDLTGPGSHVILTEPGKVSFALGPRDMDGRRIEAIVPLGAAVNWTAFDVLTVPAGYPWPRVFYYHGDDVGFAVWSRLRPIENFTWRPSKASHLDMTGAQIGYFHVHIAGPLEIILGGARVVWLEGDLDLLNVRMAAQAEMPSITFTPAPTGTVRKVPTLPALAELTRVVIEGEVAGMPFDCSSLLQFSGLWSLELRGNVTNLSALAELKELRALAIRRCPDLAGMPELRTWQHLGSFIASDVEARGGKVLRGQLNQLKKSGRMTDRSTISQLREPVWFATEHGLPFADWAGKAARQATRAYKQAAIAVARATSEGDVRSALVAFVEVFNTLPDIGTIEREDVSDAVERLAALAPAHVTPAMAQGWFDTVRDF
jgi:hypothetical protein